MSGRYALFRWPAEFAALAGFPEKHAPRWNISPHQQVLLQRRTAEGERVDSGRWGLTPPWLTDLSRTPTHARGESLATQPMFREPFRLRRCLLPANGFYEWRGNHRKRPYWMLNGEPLAWFAALWEAYPAGDQLWLSVAMVTQAAGPLRRPILLDEAGRALWQDPDSPPEALQALLATGGMPLRERVLADIVNRPEVDGPECLTPL